MDYNGACISPLSFFGEANNHGGILQNDMAQEVHIVSFFNKFLYIANCLCYNLFIGKH